MRGPGEVSLAHHGVLFLDELPEFSPQALDSLRQPLETGSVAVSRANHRVTYPARFQLVAAMNPCRCGRATEPGYACKRAPNDKCMAQYQARLLGPSSTASTSPSRSPPSPRPISSCRRRPRVRPRWRVASRRPRPAGDPLCGAGARGCRAQRHRTRARHRGGSPAGRRRRGSPARRGGPHAPHGPRLPPHTEGRPRTIADLDGAADVGRIHLAEALSYRAMHERIAA